MSVVDQESLDLAAHVVADEGWGAPDDAGSTFDALADHAVIDRALAGELRRAAGLRNLIAHGYARLDHRRMHAEAAGGTRALRRFFVAIATLAGL